MSEEKSKNTLRTVSLVLLVSGILLFISGGVLLLYGMYRNRLWGYLDSRVYDWICSCGNRKHIVPT